MVIARGICPDICKPSHPGEIPDRVGQMHQGDNNQSVVELAELMSEKRLHAQQKDHESGWNPDVPERPRKIRIAYVPKMSGKYGAYLCAEPQICEKNNQKGKKANKTPKSQARLPRPIHPCEGARKSVNRNVYQIHVLPAVRHTILCCMGTFAHPFQCSGQQVCSH